jgi:hypothetical protein
MNLFVFLLMIFIVTGVFLCFAVYARVFYAESWKDSFKGAAAISLVLAGLIVALAEFS